LRGRSRASRFHNRDRVTGADDADAADAHVDAAQIDLAIGPRIDELESVQAGVQRATLADLQSSD
jgi:hypothetical protein